MPLVVALSLALNAFSSLHSSPAPDDGILGLVVPYRTVRITSEVAGRVVSRAKDEHDLVKRGEMVVALDETLLQAALDAAKARELEATSVHEVEKIDLDRTERLVAEGAMKGVDLERARATERSAWAKVLLAQAAITEARYRLRRCRADAPLDGAITRLMVEVGEYVIPGTPLFTVIEVGRVKVESLVDAAQARRLTAGSRVIIAGSSGPLSAVIRSVAPAGAEGSRGFKVIVVAENTADDAGQRPLLPGTSVRWQTEGGR